MGQLLRYFSKLVCQLDARGRFFEDEQVGESPEVEGGIFETIESLA